MLCRDPSVWCAMSKSENEACVCRGTSSPSLFLIFILSSFNLYDFTPDVNYTSVRSFLEMSLISWPWLSGRLLWCSCCVMQSSPVNQTVWAMRGLHLPLVVCFFMLLKCVSWIGGISLQPCCLSLLMQTAVFFSCLSKNNNKGSENTPC